MKIQYSHPMLELRATLTNIESISDPVIILVSKQEMRELVRHGEAPQMFPQHFSHLASRRNSLEERLRKSKKDANSPTISTEAMQEQFDIQSRLEKQIRFLDDEIPQETKTHNGVIVRVALNV